MSGSRGERERTQKRKAAFDRLIDLLRPLAGVRTLPKGTRLLGQGEPAQGVYFVLSGTVEVSVNSKHPKRLTSRMARRGEILGLGSVFSERPAPATAEVASKALVGFVPRKTFFEFFQKNLEARLPILQLLSDEVNCCYDVIRASVRAA